MKIIFRLCLGLCLFSPLPAQERGANAMDIIRAEMLAAGIAPVRPPGLPGRIDHYLADYRRWLRRILVVPMKINIGNKPWAAEASAFVEKMIDARFSRSLTDEPEAMQAGVAKHLLTTGADDAVVLWLAAEALGMGDHNWTEARKVAARAREAFRKSNYSRTLGMQLYLQKAQRNRAAWEAEDEVAYLKSAGYLAESLKEPATWTEGDAPIYISTLYTWFSGERARLKKEIFEPLYHPAGFPEWARETLAGFWEVELGWEGRGDDWASAVSEKGWMKFGEHLGKANGHLTKGWKLEPRQPFAASRMIAVAMAGEAMEPPRVWFDRAVAAQIDYLPAWRAMSWALRPRWGGNVRAMKGLALATVECGRFDTYLPFHFVAQMDKVGEEIYGYDDSRKVYAEPAVAAARTAMLEGYTRASKSAAEKQYLAWWRAGMAWLGNDLKQTATGLAQVGSYPMPPSIRWRIACFRGDEITLRGEAALEKAGKLTAWQKMEDTYTLYELSNAEDLLNAISNVPPEAAPLVDRQRRIIDQEQKLHAGEWVKLPADPQLSEWMVFEGNWTGGANGNVSLTGDGNRALVVNRTKIGPAFEARGSVIASRTDVPFVAGFAIAHVGNAQGLGKWITAEFNSFKGNSGARIEQSWFKTGIGEKKFRCDFSKPVAWTIKVQHNRLTWTMNGEVIYAEELLARDGNLGGYYNAVRNGRFGFATRTTPEESVLTFSPIEIRRLE